MIRRGEMCGIDFHGAAGAEIQMIRPAVAVSINDHKKHMQTVTVVPLSSQIALRRFARRQLGHVR